MNSANPFWSEDPAINRHIEKVLAVSAPDFTSNSLLYKAILRYFRPSLIDTENIPSRPCLFIGNHCLFALDSLVLNPCLYVQEQRFLRSMSDRFLWNPTSEDFLLRHGAVVGHPDVCATLMRKGADLIVFPGGAHESVKTMDQKYTLQWKQRYGFVRMAAAHGYTIVPTAIVGPDEFYTHRIEGRDLPDSRFGQLLRMFGVIDDNTRSDLLAPIPSGAAGTLIPKPQRCYIKFGKAVDLANLQGVELSQQQLRSTRKKVASSIESMLSDLLLLRTQNRSRESMLRRLLTM